MQEAKHSVLPVVSYDGMTGNWTIISDKNFYNEVKTYCSKTFPGKEKALGLDAFKWEEMSCGPEAALNTPTLLGIAIDQFCNDIKSDYRLSTHQDLTKLYDALYHQYRPLEIDGNHISPHSLVLCSRKDNVYMGQPSVNAMAMKGEPARVFEQLKIRNPQYARLVLDRDMKSSNTLEKPAMISLRGLHLDKDLHIEFTDETAVGGVPDTFNGSGGDGIQVAFAVSKTSLGEYDGHSFVGGKHELVHNIYNMPLGDRIRQDSHTYPTMTSFFVLVKPGSLSDD